MSKKTSLMSTDLESCQKEAKKGFHEVIISVRS